MERCFDLKDAREFQEWMCMWQVCLFMLCGVPSHDFVYIHRNAACALCIVVYLWFYLDFPHDLPVLDALPIFSHDLAVGYAFARSSFKKTKGCLWSPWSSRLPSYSEIYVWVFPKKKGTPKMDGENNGKPDFKMGWFGKTPVCFQLTRWFYIFFPSFSPWKPLPVPLRLKRVEMLGLIWWGQKDLQ